MLDAERKVFGERLPELLGKCPGKFAVIKGEEIIGIFDTLEEALAEGARRFGGESFLARRVETSPPEVSVPALTFGLLSANPSRTVFSPTKEA